MAQSVQRMYRWWHEALAAALLREPTITNEELGRIFDRQPSTISIVRNSDSFRALMAERLARFHDEHDTIVRLQTLELAEVTADAMLRRVREKRDSIPIGTLAEIHSAAMTTLGFGQKPQATVTINNNNQVVLPPTVQGSDLLEARERLRQVQESRAQSTTLQLEHMPLAPMPYDPLESLIESDRREGRVEFSDTREDDDSPLPS